MLLKKVEETPVEEVVNPFDWPENYYMETDPEKRREILAAQDNPQEAEVNGLRMELWELRYEKMKNGKYKDCFLAAWIELLIMRSQINAPMAKRGLLKDSLKAVAQLGLPQVDYFGKDLLMEELKHMVLLYICSALDDKRYNSVIFGMGKKKKKDVENKIKVDLYTVGELIPQKLEIVEELALLTEAIELAKVHMGYDK